MSYYTLWKSPEKIGGTIALSGRLLAEIDSSSIEVEKYRGKRVFIGHGNQDQVIPVAASDVTSDFVKKLGIIPTMNIYDMAHTLSKQEIQDIVEWVG
jgi:phospholipase/carboxylesterase